MIDFQIHSPNDYKMRFFQDFIFKHIPDAKFSLFFRRCSLEEYTEIETYSLKRYNSLINQRAATKEETKEKMKQAFREYYEAVFISKIGT